MQDSLYSAYSRREAVGTTGDFAISKAVKDSLYLVTRLKNTDVLSGHTGCVNSISWNESGTRLVSASDDCHLNLYDTTRRLIWHRILTSHQSNIFSAKFLPWSNDLRVVSCAGVGTVEYSDLSPDGGYKGHKFQCQTSLTYQVATTDTNEFLTCEEKGFVRLFDLRIKSSCHCRGCKQDVLYDFPSSVTCMAVHPLSPHYLAVGLGDGTVRLLDRRKVGGALQDVNPSELVLDSTHCRYRPISFGDQSRKITSIQFNPVGSELLASYSEDYVYLFNSGMFGVGGSATPTLSIPRPNYLYEKYSPLIGRKRRDSVRHKTCSSDLRHTHNVEETKGQSSSQGQSSGANEEPPPVKKFRLRGDWSDTGPNARPEEGLPEPRGGALSNTLINRMSRMFTQWIDMSLSGDEGVPGDGVPGEGSGGQNESASSSSSSSSFNLFESNDHSSDTNHHTLPSGESATSDTNHHTLPSGESTTSDTNHHTLPSGESTTSDTNHHTLPSGESTTSAHGECLPTSDLVEGSDQTAESAELCTRQDSVAIECNHRELEDSRGQRSLATPLTVNVIEDETDSDDDHDLSHDHRRYDRKSHDIKAAHPDEVFPEKSLLKGQSAEFSDCIQPFMVYKGHRNSRTMIKQANFWGDNWILSGSDCGRMFVWDKWTGEIVNMVDGDSHVVNCVQPHPQAYVLATSGIDYNIKLWEPTADSPCCLDNVEEVVERNETMLRESRNTITVPSMFVFRILSYLNRRRRMQRDQQDLEDEETINN